MRTRRYCRPRIHHRMHETTQHVRKRSLAETRRRGPGLHYCHQIDKVSHEGVRADRCSTPLNSVAACRSTGRNIYSKVFTNLYYDDDGHRPLIHSARATYRKDLLTGSDAPPVSPQSRRSHSHTTKTEVKNATSSP